jgi:hypothetical protein
LSHTDIRIKDLSQDCVPSAFMDDVGQIQDNFDWLNDADFPYLRDTMGNEAFEDLNSSASEQLNFLGQTLQEAATNLPHPNTLVDTASQITAFLPDYVAGPILGGSPLLMKGTMQPQSNLALPPDSSEDNQVDGRSEGTLPSRVVQRSIESTFSQQILVPLRTSVEPMQTQNTPQNTDEKLTCNHMGCENMQFDRKCDLQ